MGCYYEELSAFGHIDKDTLLGIAVGGELGKDRLLGIILLNIQYATYHKERVLVDVENMFAYLNVGREDNKMVYPEELVAEAVKQRCWFEQVQRTSEFLKELAKQYHISIPEGCHSVLDFADYVDGWYDQRRRNPVWHVGYHL